MNSSELRDLLVELRHLGNDHASCEVKRARGGLPASVWETVSAFANASGGFLILGIDERNGFEVTGIREPGLMEAALGAICAEMEPPVRAQITTVELDGEMVVICEIPQLARDQRPCYKRNLGPWAGSRIRVSDGDRRLTDYEVAVLLANRSDQRHDIAPVPSASLADLDEDLIQAFLRRIRQTKGEIFRRVSDERALTMLNVLTHHEASLVPTLAGLLVFGIYPQTFEPQLGITFVAYPANSAGALGPMGERFTENQAIDGSIPVLVAECVRILKRNMKRRSVITGIYRVEEWEYPEEVLREALVNALVHRDYSEFARGMQVQVEMYPDRLLIRNPGGLFGPVEVGSLGTVTVTSSRNRALLKILEDTPFGDGHMVCENRGTGIARIRMALAEAGMEQPRFNDDISLFSVEFPNHTLLDEEAISWLGSLGRGPLSRSQMAALVVMRNGTTMTNSGYRATTGVPDSRVASRELRDLVDRGLVTLHGSGGGAIYQIAVGSVPNLFEISEIPPPPTAPSPAASEKASSNETAILSALGGARLTRAELQAATGLKPHQVSHALRLLRAHGLVRMIGQARLRTTRYERVPD
ncbi:ATP-binding protein [Micromonospora schwarzwaldensis]|uniref:ATP-binding protein n=1 Tax=Micromonospora sp. DSM 45708 TaxID=3111767 RepID=UPI0031DAB5DE